MVRDSCDHFPICFNVQFDQIDPILTLITWHAECCTFHELALYPSASLRGMAFLCQAKLVLPAKARSWITPVGLFRTKTLNEETADLQPQIENKNALARSGAPDATESILHLYRHDMQNIDINDSSYIPLITFIHLGAIQIHYM